MTWIADLVSRGISPRRDHSPRIDLALRTVGMSARLGGVPDKGALNARDEFGRLIPDMKAFGANDDTVGDDLCWGLWQRDPNAKDDRGISGWSPIWPTLLSSDPPAEVPSDGGQTVSSSSSSSPVKALPVRNTKWDRDTRFLRKDVSTPKASGKLASGWPALVTAGTEELSQEDLAFPVGGLCVSVHYGGAKNGRLGSRVYDVLGSGELDYNAWAHEQSGRRVYQLPTATGAGGIAFTRPLRAGESADDVATGGLAWQLGPDVDDQAGHGACADLPSAAGAPEDPTKDNATTEKKPAAGSIASLSQGPYAAKQNSAGAVGKLRITIFGGFGTVPYDVPWDGTQATLDWIRKNGEQAGYAAGGRLVSVEVAPGSPPPGSTTSAPAGGGNPTTVEKVQSPFPVEAIALASYRAYGPHDCGGDDCPHLIATTPRGEKIYSLHQRETTLIRGATGDAPAKHDKKIWQKTQPDAGPFWVEAYRRMDPLDSHDWLTGKLTGLRKIQVATCLGTPAGPPNDGASSGFSSASSLAPCGPWSYPSFSQAIGVTEILGRVGPQDAIDDTRFSWTLTSTQRKTYDESPVSARIVPIGDWTTRATSRCSPFNTGHSAIGGWAFVPANYDMLAQLRGKGQRCGDPGTSIVYLPPTYSKISFTVPGKNGKPTAGPTLVGKDGGITVETTDGSGTVTSSAPLWPLPATSGNPQGYIQGFNLALDSTFPSIVNVSGSTARDSTNSYDISLNSGPYAADYLSTGGLLANDALVNSDLGSMTASYTSGVAILSADLRTYLMGATLTGTVDFTARDAVSFVRTLTGHSTKFLTELKTGDLIGSASTGYFAVISIASDTSAVVDDFDNLGTGGAAATFSGKTLTNYEAVLLQIGSAPSQRVINMNAAGTIVQGANVWNNGVNASGLAVILGQPSAYAAFNQGSVTRIYPTWVYLWARRTSGGTSTLSWSTRRSSPYTPATLTGYSIWRRIGVIPIGTDNFAPYFTCSNLGPHRIYEYELSSTSSQFNPRFLSSGAATVWTRLSMAAQVPPVSTRAIINMAIFSPAAQTILYVRKASFGETAVNRLRWVAAGAGGYDNAHVAVVTDDAQCVDYAVGAGGSATFLDVIGYVDTP
jgi:hypothetical protein